MVKGSPNREEETRCDDPPVEPADCNCPVDWFRGTASAQTYLFEVERAEAAIYIESDGSATVEYTYTFVNDPSADPMEYVDIGMPNTYYYLSNITAEINGERISDITDSPYISNGVALGLGRNAIKPGAARRAC